MYRVLVKIIYLGLIGYCFLAKGFQTNFSLKAWMLFQGCERVTNLLAALKAVRCDVKFEEFWVATLEKCTKLEIKEPKEKHVSVILCCLKSIELFENASYYANHPVVK